MALEWGKGREGDESIECLRAHEVANRLGISRSTVLRLLAKRKLPGFKIGNNWLIPRSNLESYLNELSRGAMDALKQKKSV